MKVSINTNIIGQLLNQHSDKALMIDRKFPEINEWRRNESQPSVTKLTKLASFFNVPFGYFFLDKLPVINYPVPHYRGGTGNREKFIPSDELLETIRTVEARQGWAKDLKKEFDRKLPFANSLTIKSDIKEAAKEIRAALHLPINWSKNEDFKKWEDVFRYLIRTVEDAGIFVVVNGVVNNNNKRKLRVNEFRGFVLYDDYAPFIFINNNDFVTGKIFTVMHEVVHVFVGKSASFNNEELLPANVELERFCDAVAAEILVPENLLEEEILQTGVDFDKLANYFKVSRMMIAKRLYSIGKISKEQYNSRYSDFKSYPVEKSAKKTNGGNFYYTAAYRIGRSFFNLIYSSVKQNKLLYRDAFRLTTLSPKSFDGYVKKFITKQ